jgi:membrane protein required for colicin V production
MNALDYAWLAVLGLSVLLGLWRGVVREIFSLAGWVFAIAAAMTFAGSAAAALPAGLASPTVLTVASFAVIFLSVLLALSFAGVLLARMFRAAGLALADRILGSIFGFARGVLILLVVVLAAAFTPLPKEPLWRESALTPALETAVIAAKPWLPPGIADQVRYQR